MQYTKDILKRFDSLIQSHDKYFFYTTLMERDMKLTKLEAKEMTIEQSEQAEYTYKFPYHYFVGVLLYRSINTRPLSRCCKTPIYRACKALIRLLIYFRGTIEVDIIFSVSTLNLHAFSDADSAGDLDSRRSTTRCILYAAGGPIS